MPRGFLLDPLSLRKPVLQMRVHLLHLLTDHRRLVPLLPLAYVIQR